MELEQIVIAGFKGIDSFTEPNPPKREIFLGQNGTGKTSILEAIRFGITGDYPANPIRKGHEKAYVNIKPKGLGMIERYLNDGKPNQIRYNGTLTTQKSVNDLIRDVSGINPDTLKVITSGEIIRAMNAGELSKFLTESGLLPLSIDADEVCDRCGLSAKASEEVKLFLPPMPEKFGLDELSSAYDDFFDRRQFLARSLKEEKIKAEWTAPVPARTLAAIDKDIAAMSGASSEIAAYEAAKKIYDEAVLRRNRQMSEIKALEEKLSGSSCAAPDVNKKKNAEVQLQKLANEEASLSGTITVLEKNLKLSKKIISDLSSPCCPISSKIVCSTDKSAAKDEVEETIKCTEAELEKSIKTLSEIKSKEVVFKKQIEDYNKAYDAYQSFCAASEKIKALRSALIPLPTLPAEPKKLKADTVTINALNKERSEIVAYELSREAEKKADDLKKKLDVVSEIVAALNPKGGVREKVIAFGLAPLVDYCNERADLMGLGISIKIVALEGSRIYCKTKGSSGEYIPLESASSGQKALVMFLILDMMNALSGLGILFLDGLEVLDDDAFDALLNVLETAESEKTYQHIFMSAVSHADTIVVVKKHASKLKIVNL